MQDLGKHIAEKYWFDVKSLTPFKDTHIINTGSEKKVLKKTSLSADRIRFIHAAKEYLFENGFTTIDRFACTKEGEAFTIIDGTFYTVADLFDGNECNFENRNDTVQAARLLASMHKASRGFVAPEGSKCRDDLGKLPIFFTKRLEEIKKLKKVAKKGRSKFDYLFLEYIDYFIKLAEGAIDSISRSKYEDIVKVTRQKGMLCHHDFTHHNIVCGADKYYLINFDFCCFELKVYDLANLLRRKMRKCNWNSGEAKIIMDEYRSIEKINSDEFEIMKIILQFPQKFWRVVNKYYNSKRSWSEKSFVARLQEVIDEVPNHKRFIEGVDGLY